MPYFSKMEVSIVNCEKSQIDVATSLAKVVILVGHVSDIKRWNYGTHREVMWWLRPILLVCKLATGASGIHLRNFGPGVVHFCSFSTEKSKYYYDMTSSLYFAQFLRLKVILCACVNVRAFTCRCVKYYWLGLGM